MVLINKHHKLSCHIWHRCLSTIGVLSSLLCSAKFLLMGVLDKWLRRRFRLNIFLIWSSNGPFVPRSRTICEILVEGIMN